MSNEKFDLINTVLQGKTFSYEDEYAKVHQKNKEALSAIAEVENIDTSKFTQPEEFAAHFNELKKVEALTSQADAQLKIVNNVYLADMLGRRTALEGQLQVVESLDAALKASVLSRMFVALAVFFVILSVGFLYGLYESTDSYRYITGAYGFIVFIAFTRRKTLAVAPVLKQQIESLDAGIKEFAETANKKRDGGH